MLNRDEYNTVKVTNEKTATQVEFGKVQKAEFSSQKENKIPEGELNEKYVGKTIRKETSVNVQYNNKVPIHGSTTVVSSSTTATTAASAVASVVTAASVVTVTAIAVGTGISVALHDYDYNFNSFTVTANSLSYELFVVDHNNERPDGESYEEYNEQEEDEPKSTKAPLSLRVYNDYYDYSIPTYLDYNWGEFSNLKSEQTYHIVLSENRFGGDTIFDEQFTTPKEETRVSEFKGIIWDNKCNFLTMMMSVKLDYQDDYNRFSNFKFNLKSEVVSAAPEEFAYALAKTTEQQEIDLGSNQSFDLAQTYEYSFTYMDEDIEVVADSGTVHFEDNSGAVSEFHEFIFDKTANFINRTFEVQLDFVDDFNFYDNFVLSFYRTYQEEGTTVVDDMSVDVPLQKTTEVQTVDLDGYEVMLSDSYHYKLTCLYQNELTVLDEGDVTFTDTSGAITEFHELVFDKKANFDTRTFEVQLDYQNDLGYLYGFQFTLTDLETSEERTYYLLEQTEVQTITVDEVQEYIDDDPVYYIDIVNHRLSYSFKYMNQDQEVVVVSGEEFKFKNSLVSTFQGIETSYDFYAYTSDQSYMLPIKFLFDDAAHVYKYFMVNIYYNDIEYAHLEFEGDNVTHDWMYGTLLNSFDGEYDQANLIESSGVRILITASVLNVDAEENGGPDVIEEEVYQEVDVNFTLNSNQTIYGGRVISEYISTGDHQVSFMPIYTGQADNYSVYVIFECESGNTYTCPFSLPNIGSYSYVDLSLADGYDFDEFLTDFSEPVKVSIKFAPTTPGSVPDETSYQTMVIYESYTFVISA